MSPRAACRLETLGFADVYDYVVGKQDWLARGLPSEGEKAVTTRVVDVVKQDVVTCLPQEGVSAVRQRVESSPYGFALVVSEAGVLLGRLRLSALRRDAAETAGEALEPGPSTVRPGLELTELVKRLRRRDFKFGVVTMPDGTLVGVVRCSEAEARLRERS